MTYILVTRTMPRPAGYASPVVLLARKLQTAATGKFPQGRLHHIYLTQAQSIFENESIAHSVAASIEGMLG